MADQPLTDQQAQQKLAQISQQTEATTRALELPSAAELCAVYGNVKPLLNDVLPWIRKLPHGDQIVSAVTFLMKIADGVCK